MCSTAGEHGFNRTVQLLLAARLGLDARVVMHTGRMGVKAGQKLGLGPAKVARIDVSASDYSTFTTGTSLTSLKSWSFSPFRK